MYLRRGSGDAGLGVIGFPNLDGDILLTGCNGVVDRLAGGGIGLNTSFMPGLIPQSVSGNSTVKQL